MRIAVLASGSGTNLEAIIDEGLRPVGVVVDRRCRAVEVARLAGIPVEVIERGSFGRSFDRLAYTHEVVDVLASFGTEVVVMAGFMTILDKPVFDAYAGLILNTHPSLLPAFPGAHPVEEALAAGVKLTGCTVHVATLDVDSGPILAQEAVPVLAGDTADRLHERIKATERRLYPRTIREFIESRGAPY